MRVSSWKKKDLNVVALLLIIILCCIIIPSQSSVVLDHDTSYTDDISTKDRKTLNMFDHDKYPRVLYSPSEIHSSSSSSMTDRRRMNTCTYDCDYDSNYATCDSTTQIPRLVTLTLSTSNKRCCVNCLDRTFLPSNDCSTASPPLGSQIACERMESCLYNASYCNVLNFNNHVKDLTSTTPFSRFSTHPIASFYMNNASLSPTFLVDFPNFFIGLQGLSTLSLVGNGIVDLNPDRLHSLLSILAVLDVSENELTSFDICSVREPGNLQALYMDRNNISHYDNFDGCSNTLSLVTIHQNQLTSLSAYSLVSQSIGGSTVLSSVEYDQNRIETVDPLAFRGYYPVLEILSLSRNRISSLDPTTFQDLSALTGLWLDQNQLTEILPDLFSTLSALTILDLAGQTSSELELHAFSFRGLTGLSVRMVLSGGTVISKLPADVFNGLRTANIDLSTLRITEIENYAFRNTTFQSVRLTRNDILKITPLAFEGGMESMTSDSCIDFDDWELQTINDLYTCDDFENVLVYYEQTMLMTIPGTCGFSAMQACCSMGGGREYGTAVMMDKYSTVSCRFEPLDRSLTPTSEIRWSTTNATVRCGCSKRTSDGIPWRYETKASTCKQSCAAGQYWNPADISNMWSDTESGQCLSCEAGSMLSSNTHWPTQCDACSEGTFASEIGSTSCISCPTNTFAGDVGASECLTCPWGKEGSTEIGAFKCNPCRIWYLGSSDCTVPWFSIGVVLFVALAVVLFVILALRRCRKLSMEVQMRTQLLQAKLQDMELMSAAWRLNWDEIQLEESMAKGAFGEVWRGSLHHQWVVAIKTIMHSSKVNLNDDSEISFLQRARHPRLVMFLGCGRIPSDQNIFVVMEFMSEGSMDTLLWKGKSKHQDDDEQLTWSSRLQLLQDVAEGMAYLHFVFNAVHRDLKTPNVLLSIENEVLRAKVADFGMTKILSQGSMSSKSSGSGSSNGSGSSVTSKLKSFGSSLTASLGGRSEGQGLRASSSKSQKSMISDDAGPQLSSAHISVSMTTGRGTPLWMAPEIIRTMGKHDTTGFAQLTPSVDTYAFGIIMWEALMMLEPWSNVKVKWSHEIFDMVESGKRPPVDRAVRKAAPKGFEEIMESCWDQDPSRRPTFSWIIRGIQDVRVAWLKRKEKSTGFNLPRRRVPPKPRSQKPGTPLPPVPRKPRNRAATAGYRRKSREKERKKRAPPVIPARRQTEGYTKGIEMSEV